MVILSLCESMGVNASISDIVKVDALIALDASAPIRTEMGS